VSEQAKFRAMKGTRDILPPNSALWNRVEQTARDVFGTYGYSEIRTPIFEQTELFARSIGAETDVVHKEMYTLEDLPSGFVAAREMVRNAIVELDKPDSIRFFAQVLEHFANALDSAATRGEIDLRRADFVKDMVARYKELVATNAGPTDLSFSISGLRQFISVLGDRLSLRPEATASVCRAYIEHGMHTLPGNVKLYNVGPMFRRERPQKGRYRQFYQIGAEVLGQSDAPAIDAEVIEMLLVFFERVGLKGATLSVNSIGDKNCRPKYVELLREELRKVKDKLGADSQRRIETNPLRVLDSKLPEEQPIIENAAAHRGSSLRRLPRAFREAAGSELKLRGIAYEINWRLVRGLDYYMRTTFEIVAPGLGSQNAVCGGGRYDGLVELLGGPPTKGIGFAIGTDRLILSLQDAAKDAAPASRARRLHRMDGRQIVCAVRAACAAIARRGFRGGIAAGRNEIQEIHRLGGQARREICADHRRRRSRIEAIFAEAVGGRAPK
jgi:histidyl-tRNA synthetase